MNIISIKAKNFGSFELLEYDFKQNSPTLIVGENLTDDGQASNGSGKSILQAIIEYAIYTTTSRKTVAKNLINWNNNSTQAEVELVIECPIRKETLKIERIIHIKDGGKSQLSINGKIKYAFEDKMSSQIDDYIMSWIGISKEDLQNYYIINKFRYTSFFDASNTKIIQLIGRFSNSSIIDGLDKDIALKVTEKVSAQQLLNGEIDKLYGSLDVYKENLESELTRDFNSEKEVEINSINEQINSYNNRIEGAKIGISNCLGIILQNEKTSKEHQTTLDEVQAKLSTVKEVTFDKEYKELDAKKDKTKSEKLLLESKKDTIKKNQRELESILNEIERNLKGSIQCPKCKHEFLIGDSEVNIEDEKEQLPIVVDSLKKVDEQIKNISTSIETYELDIKKLNGERDILTDREERASIEKRNITSQLNTIKNHIQECSNNVSYEEGNITSLEKTISLNKENISKLKLQIEEVKNRKDSNKEKVSEIRSKIEDIGFKMDELQTQIKAIEDEKFEIMQWSLSFKEFQQYLGVKVLKIIGSYANKHLVDMGTDLRIKVEGYKKLQSGSISDKITTLIIRDGEIREYASFSGGERARLETAMILTIQKIINSSHLYNGLSFCSIDEVLESADSEGILNIMKSLMKLDYTIMLTTHVPVVSSDVEFNVLKVVKELGTSKLINN